MKRVLMVVLIAAGVTGAFLALQANSSDEPVTLENHGRHYTVRVELDQATTGQVRTDLTVEPAADAVALFAVMPDMGHSTPEITTTQRNATRFQTSGELFPMPGAWELGVRVQGRQGTEIVTFNVLVGEG